MGRTASALQELASLPPVPDGVQRLRVCDASALDVFVGVLRPQNTPVLQLELEDAASVPAYAYRCKGLAVEAELLGKSSSDGIRYTLALADPSSQHLFVVVADDLLDTIEDSMSSKVALTAFLARLRHWGEFFSRRQQVGLTDEQQQGLFAELWTLREMLAPFGVRNAVTAWTGPVGANQDFQWRSRALEVKSTAACPSLSVRVSNIKQLDDELMERITLVVVELDKIQNGGTTLPQMIDATRAVIIDSAADVEFEFLERLAQTGYVAEHDERYATVGYSVRRSRVFEVAEGFPRLMVRDIPEGVGGVTYTIDVSAMNPFESQADVEAGRFFGRGADDLAE